MHGLFNITHLITSYGYVGIFVIVFLESGIFFPLPGDSLLFSAGILAAGGLLSPVTLVAVIFVATFFGGLFGYWVGENIERFREHSTLKRILKEKHIKKTEEFFAKHGKSAVIFSRFVPIVRTFVPIVAGVAHMKYKLFLKYSLISSILWSALVTLAGYFLGHSFPWIVNYMTLVIIFVVVVSMIPALFGVFGKRS